jgi:hypothetical protein
VTGDTALWHMGQKFETLWFVDEIEVSTDVKIDIMIWIKTQSNLVNGSERTTVGSKYKTTAKMEPFCSFELLLFTYQASRYCKYHNVARSTDIFRSFLFGT